MSVNVSFAGVGCKRFKLAEGKLHVPTVRDFFGIPDGRKFSLLLDNDVVSWDRTTGFTHNPWSDNTQLYVNLSPGPPPLQKVLVREGPSDLAGSADWQKYAYNPSSAVSSLANAAFFGFHPEASLPANIPPQLVSPVFYLIRQAGAASGAPPRDRASQQRWFGAVRALLDTCGRLYDNEKELPNAILTWHNEFLWPGTGTFMSQSDPCSTEGKATVTCNGKDFLVALLECKSDAGAGYTLVRALRCYQLHYKDGDCWASSSVYRADPLPALVLLLEGAHLSFYAVWTICQNRVGYASLTRPYLVSKEVDDTSNIWRLAEVLAAYEQASKKLAHAHRMRCELEDAVLDRMVGLRAAAHTVQEGGGLTRSQPCTLPYSLLDEQLGLSDISFHGPAPYLVYSARQRVVEGGAERHVLVKFVKGRYGTEVHKAWHAAGVAPELHDVQSVGGGSMLMVVMERLRWQDGWVSLRDALEDSDSYGGVESVRQAVREALQRAHAAPVGESGRRAVHGDVRRPNIWVRKMDSPSSDNPSSGFPSLKVAIIDYDWAGLDGEAAYPSVALSDEPQWHPAVCPGAVMWQQHDVHLLEHELD